MGRPIGSVNRDKPFKEQLRMAVRERPFSLRRIAHKILDKAEEGDLAAARELADRLDGKPAQMQVVDFSRLTPAQLTDELLDAIAAGGLTETDELIESDCEPKALPAPGKSLA